jgi:hypothetical protein
MELVLPLLGEADWAHDQAPLEIARAIISLIRRPAMMVFPAPGSSARRTPFVSAFTMADASVG